VGADKALGRSRGGLTTRIHLLTNQQGEPIDFRITAGQVNDCTQAVELLGGRRAEAAIADKGYDGDSILAHIEGMKAEAVIPSRRCRKEQRRHNEQLCKQRNRIERCFRPSGRPWSVAHLLQLGAAARILVQWPRRLELVDQLTVRLTVRLTRGNFCMYGVFHSATGSIFVSVSLPRGCIISVPAPPRC
jgi:transposase